MNLFQIVLMLLVVCLFVASIGAILRGWIGRREGLVWVFVWVAAGITIAWPGVTAIVASALGIGRGADLVLYCAVMTMLVGFLMVYVRLRRLRRELTLLVRRMAILNPVTNPSPPAERSARPSHGEQPS